MKWGKFIPTLEKHFPDILEEILNHDHQRCASEKVKVSQYQKVVVN